MFIKKSDNKSEGKFPINYIGKKKEIACMVNNQNGDEQNNKQIARFTYTHINYERSYF